jgi:metallophosphoesterase superfamily enzyme
MLILNDTHLGFTRNAGTTPASRENLRTYLFEQLEKLLKTTDEKHLLIVGDLFDNFEIPTRDWLQTYVLLLDWVGRLGRELTLVAGNHDWSPKGTRMSSFEMLCRVLQHGPYKDSVNVCNIDEGLYSHDERVVVVAHCSNQDVFNQRLGQMIDDFTARPQDERPTHLFLHANFDNNFAAQSDHSLNVSREQAQKFIDLGIKLVFAHEHQNKVDMGGSVIIMGNQWPTSISDCLNNGVKMYHVLRDGELTGEFTWQAQGSFYVVNWRELADFEFPAQFVRVAGEASENEAADAINAVAKFRQRSEAFVVTNAVKIAGIAQDDTLPEQIAEAAHFSIIEFMRERLEQAESEALDGLMAKAAQS